ncbi:MAG: hypothetical protein WBO70_01560 [Erysipelotrichaceae bacterium]
MKKIILLFLLLILVGCQKPLPLKDPTTEIIKKDPAQILEIDKATSKISKEDLALLTDFAYSENNGESLYIISKVENNWVRQSISRVAEDKVYYYTVSDSSIFGNEIKMIKEEKDKIMNYTFIFTPSNLQLGMTSSNNYQSLIIGNEQGKFVANKFSKKEFDEKFKAANENKKFVNENYNGVIVATKEEKKTKTQLRYSADLLVLVKIESDGNLEEYKDKALTNSGYHTLTPSQALQKLLSEGYNVKVE